MYNQHTRGMATTRHRSLVERGRRKALLEALHTTKKKRKKSQEKPDIHESKSFEHIELPAKLLDYFLRRSKNNINQSPTAKAMQARHGLLCLKRLMSNPDESWSPSVHNADSLRTSEVAGMIRVR